MPLWGTDETKSDDKSISEKKPTWQKDRDPTGSKGRPAINEERNTFATSADRTSDTRQRNSGWVRRIVKRTNDGTERVIEELLVATNKSAANPTAVSSLPDRLGAANVTSVQFRNTSIAANSTGFIDTSANVVIDVSFNEPVNFVGGTPVIRLANATTNINATAYPAEWNGIASTWVGSQNNTNLITFTLPVSPTNTGNGELKITASTLWLDGGSITDNIGAATSIIATAGNRRDSTAGGGGTTPILSVANCVISGNAIDG